MFSRNDGVQFTNSLPMVPVETLSDAHLELAHDVVEGLLGVEHHRPQLAVADVDARLLKQRRVDAALDVSQLGEAEGVGEPLRGPLELRGGAARPTRR